MKKGLENFQKIFSILSKIIEWTPTCVACYFRDMLNKSTIEKDCNITTNDIAFLPGYQEINSFLRAFGLRTGVSISEYRNHK